jgi:hypothetical protein
MANNKEEAGKGTPRPGEMPGAKRPYATIDLTASEVESSTKDRAPAAAASAASAAEAGSGAKADTKSSSSAQQPKAGASSQSGGPGNPGDSKVAGAMKVFGAEVHSASLLTHLAAGVVGGLIALTGAHLLTPDRPTASPQELGDLTRRTADLENALGTRPGAGLRARIEELTRSTSALGETQAKLARESKALETKITSAPDASPELVGRLAKLEDALGAATAADPAAQSPQVAALSGRLAEIDRSVRQAGEAARSGAVRFDGELSTLRTDAARLAQRLDNLKGEVEERLKGAASAADIAPLTSKLASLERDAQAFVKSEADRAQSSAHMLLALELAGLKRAAERGESYTEELARAKKLAGATVNFAPLERYMREGAPPAQELAKSFPKVANAMLDAEAEAPNATLLDRLMSGARSIVRVRKVGQPGDDTSLEATIARMETAVKDGRLPEVLAQAKKLPPKAALAGEDWIRKVEARQAVNQAVADVEATLRSSLSGPGNNQGAAPEAKR